MKKMICMIITFLTVFPLCGCFYSREEVAYKGEYPALFTEACISDYSATGYRNLGEVALSAEIVLLDTDRYGRTLFCYSEYESLWPEAILVCQYYTDTEVFFYHGYNIITMKKGDTNLSIHDDPQIILDYYGEENIEALKEWNDWDKPIDESKCISAEITNDPYYFTEISIDKETKKKIQEFGKSLAQAEGLSDYDDLRTIVYRKDPYGNILFNVIVELKNMAKESDKPADYRYDYMTYGYLAIISKSGEALPGNNYFFEWQTNIIYGEKNSPKTVIYYLKLGYYPDYEMPRELKRLYDSNYWYIADIDEVIANSAE